MPSERRSCSTWLWLVLLSLQGLACSERHEPDGVEALDPALPALGVGSKRRPFEFAFGTATLVGCLRTSGGATALMMDCTVRIVLKETVPGGLSEVEYRYELGVEADGRANVDLAVGDRLMYRLHPAPGLRWTDVLASDSAVETLIAERIEGAAEERG